MQRKKLIYLCTCHFKNWTVAKFITTPLQLMGTEGKESMDQARAGV